MKRRFNTTGLCDPESHYMVNIDDRLDQIKQLVDQNQYFVINRAHQYGKTTTLNLLAHRLFDQYIVFSISFEGLGDIAFSSTYAFCRAICGLLYDTIVYGEVQGIDEYLQEELRNRSTPDLIKTDFRDLSNLFSSLCASSAKPVVLIIDEVDQASSQAQFLSFLGMLRDKYLKRGRRPAFQSVILAGVYDIKNLKLKIRGNESIQYNSPWNIAADFHIDMNFTETDIAGMLSEYKLDHDYVFDTDAMAKLIFDYTSGYPFLVSRICEIIDERLPGNSWTKDGFLEAIRILLTEKNTLFESMIAKLYDYPELKDMVQALLFTGQAIVFNPDNTAIDVSIMFGFAKVDRGNVVIANRIFETRLYNMFLSVSKVQNTVLYKAAQQDKNQFIQNGFLNMDLVIEKFAYHFSDLYGSNEKSFIEEDGRRYFLLYLRPIINGTGNYYVEARTRDLNRTDVIVDYHGQQFIIEMKIWRGEKYNQKGEQQLAEYLDSYHLKKGYLLSFNFNKNKKVGVKKITYEDKEILEAIV